MAPRKPAAAAAAPEPTPQPSDRPRPTDTAQPSAEAAAVNLIAELAVEPTPTPDNLRIWNLLKRTDPKATKPFQRAGGFRGTQIDPVWRIQMMTEQFGPVGQGWGFEQLEWTIAERMVFICCRVWYVENGQKFYTGPQWGGTELVRRNKDGTERPDDEAFKMSITDAVGKCLMYVGLAADVYLGQFDDSKYRDESAAFYEQKNNPGLSAEAIAKYEAEIKAKVSEVEDLDALDELWKGGANARIREIGAVDKAAQQRMISYFSQRKSLLERSANAA